MKMTEGLLFGNQLNMIVARVADQFVDLSRCQRSAFRPNQRMRLVELNVCSI